MLDLRTFMRRAAEANKRANATGTPVQDVLKDMAREEAEKARRKREEEMASINALANSIGTYTQL